MLNTNSITITEDKVILDTKDKVTDFRHLNVRIAKNNLIYPLL